MFGEKAVSLVKELHRCPDEQLHPVNEDLLRQVYAEMGALFEANKSDIEINDDNKMIPSIHLRHSALEHNRRCVLAYLKQRLNRITQFRWDHGAVLPEEIQVNMQEHEKQWFNKYNKSLANYMLSMNGLDITQNTVPPKSLKIQVRCLEEYGELETDSGDIVMLTLNSEHYLPLSECEHLIKQGVLQHMGS
ncbi:DNA replication complex GINS protein PSF1-like [Bolinopsis microptera]|uniref:DNA replication complex GINS protein PSF1-like n=1 Tax=Bolinopsis microptera TaxID=2820187 RepID=UPI003079E049